jgi:hypothetical protein
VDVCEVLVAVEVGDGRRGVVRGDDGAVWLSRSVDRVSGPRVDDYRPAQVGLDGDRTLLGGLLPSGAISAEAVDDRGHHVQAVVGNGAWAVVLEQPMRGPMAAVCRRDAQGQPVASALPANWTRRAVTDTNEPCPACRAVAWDEVLPTDDSRGSGSTPGRRCEPTPIVVCRTCGYEESIGSVIRFESPDAEDPAEVAERIRAWDASQRAEQIDMLAQVSFPIYAVVGWPAKLTGHGGSTQGLGGPLTRVKRVTISHRRGAPDAAPQLHVQTAIVEHRRGSQRTLAREALQRSLHDSSDKSPPHSDAAFALSISGGDRERRKLAALAEVTERLIQIDGSPQRFTYIETADRWAAVTHANALTITITGHGIAADQLTLMPVADPAVDLFRADKD